MNHRRSTESSSLCAWSVLVVFAAAATLNAEQIQFSKPAVEIAAPPKGEQYLPSIKEERIEFGAPAVAPTIVRPEAAIIRRAPRDGEEEEDEDGRSPFRRPGRHVTRPGESDARRLTGT